MTTVTDMTHRTTTSTTWCRRVSQYKVSTSSKEVCRPVGCNKVTSYNKCHCQAETSWVQNMQHTEKIHVFPKVIEHQVIKVGIMCYHMNHVFLNSQVKMKTDQ